LSTSSCCGPMCAQCRGKTSCFGISSKKKCASNC
jgi:hypothetical protein